MSTVTSKKVSNRKCTMFGLTAVKMGFITYDQLRDALCIQIDDEFSGKEHRLLGTILFEKKWMDGDQIQVTLNLMSKEMRSDNEAEKTNP